LPGIGSLVAANLSIVRHGRIVSGLVREECRESRGRAEPHRRAHGPGPLSGQRPLRVRPPPRAGSPWSERRR